MRPSDGASGRIAEAEDHAFSSAGAAARAAL